MMIKSRAEKLKSDDTFLKSNFPTLYNLCFLLKENNSLGINYLDAIRSHFDFLISRLLERNKRVIKFRL